MAEAGLAWDVRGTSMPVAILFQLQLVLGYVAWLVCFGVYVWPRLSAMSRFDAHRAIATLHSFRFFGWCSSCPRGRTLPAGFATFAAYGDLATGRWRCWRCVRPGPARLLVFHRRVQCCRGLADLLLNYYHAIRSGLPAVAGQLAAACWIPCSCSHPGDYPCGRLCFAAPIPARACSSVKPQGR